MKNDRFKAKLAALEQLGKAYDPVAGPALLRSGLTDRSNFIVAKAAQVIGEAYLTDFVPVLSAAFARLLERSDRAETRSRAADENVRRTFRVVRARSLS